MRIAFLEVRNFRGIHQLDWAPGEKLNCLIGPGDSTKTTILDAIELVLNPRSYLSADDADFYELDVTNPITITATLIDLPRHFCSEENYGMYLRGWNRETSSVEDEPNEHSDLALSVRVRIDESLETHWFIFNDRIAAGDKDPPIVRYKDAKLFSTTRLGPYAERHLTWSRQSVLNKSGEKAEGMSLQLATVSRKARDLFRQSKDSVFQRTVTKAEDLSKTFSVPVRDKYSAQLDVQGVGITAGGISLHDGNLPLRRLGTGSSRLIVSALQHDLGNSHIALIDELEHGLEPHRIARLLKYVKMTQLDGAQAAAQVFTTTHSPVVIREAATDEIYRVKSRAGTTTVQPISFEPNSDIAPRLQRSAPDAFLARKVFIGEGRTEQGLARGLDEWWTRDKDSFALRSVIPIDGCGVPSALDFANHLLTLGYRVLTLLDSDRKPPEDKIDSVRKKGGIVEIWPDDCSTEMRIFLDVPWETLVKLIRFAEEMKGADSIKQHIDHLCDSDQISRLPDLTLSASLDTLGLRRVIGKAACKKHNEWFKGIPEGEKLAEIIAPCLSQIEEKPLAQIIKKIRTWVDE